MTPLDRDAFAEALRAVGIVCNRRVDDETIGVYYRLLQEQPVMPLIRALERFARTAETGRRFPSPKEIREWMPKAATPVDVEWRRYYATLTPEWWRAHWKGEDERTGRWKHRIPGEEG